MLQRETLEGQRWWSHVKSRGSPKLEDHMGLKNMPQFLSIIHTTFVYLFFSAIKLLVIGWE